MKLFLTFSEFDDVLAQLLKIHKIIGPVALPKRGRFSDTDLLAYGTISTLSELMLEHKTYRSAKEVVLPITQTLLRYVHGTVVEPIMPEQNIILFCRACDIHAIDRLDALFIENGGEPDSYYQKLRESLNIVLIECKQPFDSCFCVAMGTNRCTTYDAALSKTAEGLFVDCNSRFFCDIFGNRGVGREWTLTFPEENGTEVTPPATLDMPKELFHAPLWEEYTRRCIACGRCTTSCPTCSCYSVFDTSYDAMEPGAFAERKRTWDSCHLDGFSDMAGGAVMRRENGSRMRFKTFHKIYDYRKRFGKNMCVGCGRCDDVCPEYISFANCINKITAATTRGETTP